MSQIDKFIEFLLDEVNVSHDCAYHYFSKTPCNGNCDSCWTEVLKQKYKECGQDGEK